MRGYGAKVHGKPQCQREYGNSLRCFFNLQFSGRLRPKINFACGAAGCVVRAAEGDADAAGVAPPGMAFAAGEGGTGFINLSVAVDVQMVVGKSLSVMACRPVQIDAADPAFRRRSQLVELAETDGFFGVCHVVSRPFTL